MISSKPDWKANEALAAGKGATVQEFVATVGNDKLEIDVAPWGEGHLKVNGRELAHINDAKDRRQAFRELKMIAERYLEAQVSKPLNKRNSPMIPVVKAKLLEGKRGLIVGIANENSIAWGCAKAFRVFGAELAVTYLNDKAKKGAVEFLTKPPDRASRSGRVATDKRIGRARKTYIRYVDAWPTNQRTPSVLWWGQNMGRHRSRELKRDVNDAGATHCGQAEPTFPE
jgi:hypothetical protein